MGCSISGVDRDCMFTRMKPHQPTAVAYSADLNILSSLLAGKGQSVLIRIACALDVKRWTFDVLNFTKRQHAASATFRCPIPVGPLRYADGPVAKGEIPFDHMGLSHAKACLS